MSLETKHAILDALLTVLDADHAQAVLDHRKGKKSPLTAFAANLLAKQFALCPDPNAAAEEMILRGWTGFRADWIRNSAPRSGTIRRTFLDSVMEDIHERRSNVGNCPDDEQFRPDGKQSRPDTRHLQIGFAGPIIPSRH
jgi:hypothetical protein